MKLSQWDLSIWQIMNFFINFVSLFSTKNHQIWYYDMHKIYWIDYRLNKMKTWAYFFWVISKLSKRFVVIAFDQSMCVLAIIIKSKNNLELPSKKYSLKNSTACVGQSNANSRILLMRIDKFSSLYLNFLTMECFRNTFPIYWIFKR